MKDADRRAVRAAMRGYSNGGRIGFSMAPARVWHLIRPGTYCSRRDAHYYNYPTVIAVCGCVVETEAMLRTRAGREPDRVLIPDRKQRPCGSCSAAKPFVTTHVAAGEWAAATAELVSLYERLYPTPNLGLGDLAPLQE